jgi:hypothetical protein
MAESYFLDGGSCLDKFNKRSLTQIRSSVSEWRSVAIQKTNVFDVGRRTALNAFYRIAFRRKIYRSIKELQADLDEWITNYNEQRPHQGRWCFGKTPMQTFLHAMPMAKEKMIAA